MTYTVLATDPATGALGIACATGGHACGAVVPALDPALGVVASQAWVDPALRGVVLAGMRAGKGVDAAVAEALSADPGADMRQVAALSPDGDVAWHTGSGCTQWAGERFGTGWIAIGNHLTGPEVLEAASAPLATLGTPHADETGELYVDASGEQVHRVTPGAIAGLSRTLLMSLAAGQRAGGDSRGPRSAALLVAHRSDQVAWPPDVAIDLRVDDHADPVRELSRLLEARLTGPERD